MAISIAWANSNVICAVWNTNASRIAVNGSVTLQSFGSTSLGGITVGAWGGGGQPFRGDIAEVLVFSTAVSSNDENSVGYYLADKYSVTTDYTPPPPPGGTVVLIR